MLSQDHAGRGDKRRNEPNTKSKPKPNRFRTEPNRTDSEPNRFRIEPNRTEPNATERNRAEPHQRITETNWQNETKKKKRNRTEPNLTEQKNKPKPTQNTKKNNGNKQKPCAKNKNKKNAFSASPFPPTFPFSPSRRQRDRRTSTGWGSRYPRRRTTAIPIPASGRSPRSPKFLIEPGQQATV